MSKKANPIIESWTINAKRWIKTIENDEIESRRLVTNAAILENILKLKPKKVLDIGCGEGWLVSALTNQKKEVTGIDAIETLIQRAKLRGKGSFYVINYQELIKGKALHTAPFDLISINFALFEKRETAQLLKKLPDYLTKNGKVIIQTLHPFSLDLTKPYQSGWRKDSYKGLKRNFEMPYKWYYRTLEDWIQLFKKSDLNLIALKEPIHPITERPASVIFILKKKKG